MKRKIYIPGIYTVALILAATVLLRNGVAFAQDESPLKASVTFEKAVFDLDDPDEKITAHITLQNISGSDIWTQEGFSNFGFHFYLFFKGPGTDGPLITFMSQSGGSTTPGVEPHFQNVELLSNEWLITMPIDDVRDNYPLSKPGQYKVWFSMPFVQYDGTLVEPAVDGNGNPIPGKWAVPSRAMIWTEPIEFKETYITLIRTVTAVTSDVRVVATEYKFGKGNHPRMTKEPLTNLDVRLYKKSDIAAAGISPLNHQFYGSIATNDNIPRITAQRTALPGEYIFKSISQDAEGYLILGQAASINDYKHLGRIVEGNDPKWGIDEIFKSLILLSDYRGKKSPGKSKKLSGSELHIIEPEYVEWSSGEELYPFAFESVGDWGVEVSVLPPKGFVVDQPSLSETVSSEMEALQFTIADVGTEWKPSCVQYTIKHKNKKQPLYSVIGLKLTTKQAKELGVDIWQLPEAEREFTQEMSEYCKELEKQNQVPLSSPTGLIILTK